MPTLKQVAYDVMNQMGYNHDDASRSLVAVMYNVKVCIDKLKGDDLKRNLKSSDQLAMQEDLSIWTVDLFTQDDRGWRYFDLPGLVYSLQRDGGIAAINYYRLDLPPNCPPQVARVQYRPVALSWLNNIWNSRWQFVSKEQPVYARAMHNGIDRVYVFGQDEAIDQLEVELFLAVPRFEDINPDELIEFPENRMHTLKRMVIELERWSLSVPQDRLKNDGRDFEPNQITRTPPLTSVNDPINSDD